MLEIALVENIQRENLNPIEIALSLKELILSYQFSQDQLAKKVGKKRSSIANYLSSLHKATDIIYKFLRRQRLIRHCSSVSISPWSDYSQGGSIRHWVYGIRAHITSIHHCAIARSQAGRTGSTTPHPTNPGSIFINRVGS